MKKIIDAINNAISFKEKIFIIFIVTSFFFLRLPSLIEPYWYGDEGIYEVMGMAMREGRLLYAGIWDNKPPLLYIIYAIFDGDQFYVRLLSLIFGVLSILALYLLSTKLFKSVKARIAAVSFYAILFGIPSLEGNIANAENFMHLPVILAFYFAFSSRKSLNFRTYIISGILLSFAFLIKIVAVFDLAAIFFALFVLRIYDEVKIDHAKITFHVRKIIKGFEQETILVISFLIPVVLTAVYFWLYGAYGDFFRASFSQNVGYVGYGNFFLVPMGLIFLKLFILIFSLLILVRYRKTFGVVGVIILSWVIFSLFGTLFSQRPYTHYVLVALPAIALFVGYIFEHKKIVKITIPLFLIVLILIFQVFRLNFKKVVPYYLNYINFVFNEKSLVEYRGFFDRNTPRDYEIAEFIKTKTSKDENVFLWSDSAQIYALSDKLPPGRYMVGYHITFYPEAIEETKKAIEEKKPKYIIQTKEGRQIEHFLDKYTLRYKLNEVKIYERDN